SGGKIDEAAPRPSTGVIFADFKKRYLDAHQIGAMDCHSDQSRERPKRPERAPAVRRDRPPGRIHVEPAARAGCPALPPLSPCLCCRKDEPGKRGCAPWAA